MRVLYYAINAALNVAVTALVGKILTLLIVVSLLLTPSSKAWKLNAAARTTDALQDSKSTTRYKRLSSIMLVAPLSR